MTTMTPNLVSPSSGIPTLVTVHVEIEKGSNIKYEYDEKTQKMVVDRILPPPFFYPYAYGFIPNTLADDGDAVDVILVSGSHYTTNSFCTGRVVAVLNMEDEKGMDEKLIVVPEHEFPDIQDMDDLSRDIMDSLWTFFSTYKTSEPGKWARVYGIQCKEKADQLYDKYSTAWITQRLTKI
jgi:inorganic pyrophosphatase